MTEQSQEPTQEPQAEQPEAGAQPDPRSPLEAAERRQHEEGKRPDDTDQVNVTYHGPSGTFIDSGNGVTFPQGQSIVTSRANVRALQSAFPDHSWEITGKAKAPEPKAEKPKGKKG